MEPKHRLVEAENQKLFPERMVPGSWEEMIKRQGEIRGDRAFLARYNVIAERYYEAVYQKRGTAWIKTEGPYILKGDSTV